MQRRADCFFESVRGFRRQSKRPVLDWPDPSAKRSASLYSVAAMVLGLAVFYCLFWQAGAEAAAPLMAIPGQMNLLPSAAPGDMQLQASNFGQTPNVNASGAFAYSIPIQVPPGTHGMAPKLALSYSSAGGDGSVGIGWSLSGASVITRCPQTVAQDNQDVGVGYNANDRFCLDGQRLLVLNNGTYGASNTSYQTEVSNYAKITYKSNIFTVTYPNGMTYEYGNGNGSAVVAYNSSIVRLWALDKISDSNGNYISFTYSSYGGGLDYALTEIDYTGTSNSTETMAPYNSVCFSYATRQDLVTGYQSGYELEPSELLQSITTWTGGTGCSAGTKRLVYTLSYNQANWSGGPSSYWHNELVGLTECDAVSPNNCLASLSFTWQGLAANWSMSTSANSKANGAILLPGDFNGDGLTDALIYTAATAPADCNGVSQIYYGPSFTNNNSDTASYNYWETNDGQYQTYNQAPACFQDGGNGYQPWVADYNADGFSDVILSETEYGYQGNTTGPRTQSVASNGSGSYTQTNGRNDNVVYDTWPAFVSGDMNGDGRTDFFALSLNTSNDDWYANLWTGTGGGDFSEGATVANYNSGDWLYGGNFLGNGCTGVLSQENGGTNQILGYCAGPLPNNNTVVLGASAGVSYFGGDGHAQIIIGDFNGDGKDDVLVVPSSGTGTLYLSTGAGLVQAWTTPASWDSFEFVAGDFNGDGKTDIALISETPNHNDVIELSTGSGFVGAGLTLSAGASGRSAVAADWNNDGATDLWIQTQSKSTDEEVVTTYAPELMNGITSSTGVNGTSASIAITYAALNSSSTLYQKGTGQVYPKQDVNGPIYVVSGISTSATNVPLRSWAYTYQGLVRNVIGRGLMGFGSITVSDQQKNIQTTTTYNNWFPVNGLPVTVTSVINYQKNNVTLNSTSYNWYANPVYGTNASCPNPNSTPTGQVVCLLGTTVNGSDLNGTVLPTVTTSYQYDSYGSVVYKQVAYSDTTNGTELTSTTQNGYTELSNYVDFLSTVSVNNVTPTSNITRNYQFTHTATGQVLKAEDQPGTGVEFDITYGYDGWGNVGSATYYDPNSATNGNTSPSREWQYSYTDTNSGDVQGQFPYQTTNPLNYPVSADYAPGSGGITSFTDLNGHAASATFDSFGRPISITKPDGTSTNVGYYFCNNPSTPYYPCVGGATYEVITTPEYGGTQNGPTTIAFYDAINRPLAQLEQGIEQTTAGPIKGCWSEVDYTYDTLGYLNSVTRPYYNGAPSTSGCGVSPLTGASYVNDPLGRVQQVTQPNGRVDTYGYSGVLTSTVVDSTDQTNSQTTTTTRNDAGWIIEVTDANSGNLQYTYDAFGDPVKINPPKAGVVITNNFDLRGRKTSTTDPDMGPDGGSWSYTFDAFNELTAQQSPNEAAVSSSTQTSLVYDSLGRIVSRGEPDMQASWCYDGSGGGGCPSSAGAVGLMTEASCSGAACVSGGYSRTYSYDSLSRPASVAINNSACTPCTSTISSYDARTQQLGKVITFSGVTVKYQYDSTYGFLDNITQNGANVWSMSDLDPSLRIQDESLAGGMATISMSYDPNTGNVATIYGSGNNPGNLANLSYAWDVFGNLSSRGDGINNYTEFFCYDKLNRLTNSGIGSVNCSNWGGGQQSIEYDQGEPRDGNITGKSDIGVYSYNGNNAGPHAVTSIDTTAGESGGCALTLCLVDGISNPKFYYDNDGNMQCVTPKGSCDNTAARNYTWTYGDMIEGIAAGSNAATIGYTPEHSRGVLTTASSTMYYLNNPAGADSEELVTGATPQWRTYVYAYGHIVAELFTSSGTTTPYYFVGDHLSSTTGLGDATGKRVEYDSYDAWGLARNPDGNAYSTGCQTLRPTSKTLRRYTGQEAMDAYCLTNLNGRFYDPALGRMLSADPMVSMPAYGQNFDRYSYALNNPLGIVDPSGLSNTVCPTHCTTGTRLGINETDMVETGIMASLAFGGNAPTGAGGGASGPDDCDGGDSCDDDDPDLSVQPGFVPDISAQCDGIDCTYSLSFTTAVQPVETVLVLGYTLPDPNPWWTWTSVGSPSIFHGAAVGLDKLGWFIGGQELGTDAVLAMGSSVAGNFQAFGAAIGRLGSLFMWTGVALSGISNISEAADEMQNGISPNIAIPGATVNFIASTVPTITLSTLTYIGYGGAIGGLWGAAAGAAVGLATNALIQANLPNNETLGEMYNNYAQDAGQYAYSLGPRW